MTGKDIAASPAKASEKNSAVSTAEPNRLPASGACHQLMRRSRLNTPMSRSWPNRKAVPEASAMRGVASQIDSITARAKPKYTTCRATAGPKRRLVRSLTRKATG